jgi:hypothetical protein
MQALEKSLSATRAAVSDLEKLKQERDRLRVRAEILEEDNQELRDSKAKDQQKYNRDLRRLSGM